MLKPPTALSSRKCPMSVHLLCMGNLVGGVVGWTQEHNGSCRQCEPQAINGVLTSGPLILTDIMATVESRMEKKMDNSVESTK